MLPFHAQWTKSKAQPIKKLIGPNCWDLYIRNSKPWKAMYTQVLKSDIIIVENIFRIPSNCMITKDFGKCVAAYRTGVDRWKYLLPQGYGNRVHSITEAL